MTTLIDTISDVELSFSQVNPPQLQIVSHGTVPTTGYSQPVLVPKFTNANPPANGIYEFDFIVTKPDAGTRVGQMVTTEKAVYVVTQVSPATKKIVVHGKTNSKEMAMIDPK